MGKQIKKLKKSTQRYEAEQKLFGEKLARQFLNMQNQQPGTYNLNEALEYDTAVLEQAKRKLKNKRKAARKNKKEV
jgi:hypothetical protein